MKIVTGKDIRSGLQEINRVYICGNLQKPQEKPQCIATDGLEIGITRYTEYTAEKPHIHTFNTEYNFVIEGTLKVYVFDEQKEYILESNDLFVIEPGMAYITKAKEGSQVIFIKSPGGNDKKLIEISQEVECWMSDWEKSM